MSKDTVTVPVEFLLEKKGRFTLEQLPEDPEYFHVYDGEDLVEIGCNYQDARELFESLYEDSLVTP